MYRIYKITSPQEEEYCYVGKTKKSLNIRFIQHKHNYKKWLNGRYCHTTSFDIVKHPDAIIELVEDGLDELQAAERERYWILQFNTVNKQIPGRTDSEWYQDNPDYNKQYYIENREKILEYYSQKILCDCGCFVRRGGIARHKRSIKHQQQLA
jgi:hypothetical protein